METTNNNQPKHTQGEWEAKSNGCIHSKDFGGITIATVNYISRNPEESNANAKLIASAPEMLEFVKAMTKYCEKEGVKTGSLYTWANELYKKATE